MIETKIEIGDPENPTTAEEMLLQNNDIALSVIHDAIDEKEEKREKKDEKKDEKKKSVAFKATLSKGKAKQETSSEEDESWDDDDDDEKMALFVKRFGKFMVKKGYRARRGLHPRTRKNQEGASSVESRIILLLNAHTIAIIMMMTRRARRRTRRKKKKRRTR